MFDVYGPKSLSDQQEPIQTKQGEVYDACC